jgi:hypothetical protein
LSCLKALAALKLPESHGSIPEPPKEGKKDEAQQHKDADSQTQKDTLVDGETAEGEAPKTAEGGEGDASEKGGAGEGEVSAPKEGKAGEGEAPKKAEGGEGEVSASAGGGTNASTGGKATGSTGEGTMQDCSCMHASRRSLCVALLRLLPSMSLVASGLASDSNKQ